MLHMWSATPMACGSLWMFCDQPHPGYNPFEPWSRQILQWRPFPLPLSNMCIRGQWGHGFSQLGASLPFHVRFFLRPSLTHTPTGTILCIFQHYQITLPSQVMEKAISGGSSLGLQLSTVALAHMSVCMESVCFWYLPSCPCSFTVCIDYRWVWRPYVILAWTVDGHPHALYPFQPLHADVVSTPLAPSHLCLTRYLYQCPQAHTAKMICQTLWQMTRVEPRELSKYTSYCHPYYFSRYTQLAKSDDPGSWGVLHYSLVNHYLMVCVRCLMCNSWYITSTVMHWTQYLKWDISWIYFQCLNYLFMCLKCIWLLTLQYVGLSFVYCYTTSWYVPSVLLLTFFRVRL